MINDYALRELFLFSVIRTVPQMQYFLDVFQNIKTSDLNKNITVIKQEEK